MSETAKASEIKVNIINLLMGIDDIKKLKHIYKQAAQLNEKPDKEPTAPLSLGSSTVEIDEGISFQQILKEQDYKPVRYKEFRKIADQIEWEHSLEELLKALD